MKAAELLRLYEAGRRDFSEESLRGQNFKGKDLSGVDFSRADIRSTNFTNAKLTGANFTQAKAGLQRRWAAGLIVVLLLLSVASGIFLSSIGFIIWLIFDSNRLESQILGPVALAVVVIFLLLLLRKGLGVFTGSGVVIGVVASVLVGAIALIVTSVVAGSGGMGSVAGSVAMIVALAVIGSVALVSSVAGALAVADDGAGVVALAVAGTLTITLARSGYRAGPVAGALTIAVTIAMTLVSAYVGWRALKGNERDAWIRPVIVAFAAIGGTSFRGATLTDADFSQARLKSSDFRRSVLLRTRWREAEKLDRMRPGETYLNNPKICELVLTGNGQGQSYDYLLNLVGINLQGANLVNADFTSSNLKDGALQGANLANASLNGANLNGAYLQDADLSNAKLAQTQLDEADLTGTTLTGACIEDWGITTRTKLHGIRCDYVFMRLLSDRRPDQNPHRKPDDWSKTFADGEFVDFIAPMVETLDLYHNQAVDPRVVAIAFSDLRQRNPNTDLEIISMEKRGQNLDKFNLRVRTSSQADLSQLHHQYFDRYEHLLTLPPQALIALLIEKEDKSQMLAGMIGTAINRPGTHINTYQNQGDTTVSEQGSNASKYNLSNAQFAGGFAETVHGDQIGGTINNQAAETPSLAEAAAEIQNLLKQLAASNPEATEAEQTAYLSALIPPTRRERFVGALKAASGAAIEEVPYGAVLKALVEGWQKPEG